MNNSSTVIEETAVRWHAIDWANAYNKVKNLRQRIFKATMNKDWKKVRGLQKLMLKSRANLLISVRRACQINRGCTTPGVDRVVALLPEEREKLIKALSSSNLCKPLPARRVYIPKAGSKKRPLGIPCLVDRIQQAISKNALEPFWEALFEESSFGFRPGRSAHDAIERIYLATKSGSTRTWILDADIKGCFDNIDHEELLTTIGHFPGRGMIKAWLKSGYVESGAFYPTDKGTPQGGIISPLLANIALHGMEKALNIEYYGGLSSSTVKTKCPVIVRYADDFLVFCRSESQAILCKERLSVFLAKRGLEFSEEKTRITTLERGVDFLGFNIRSYAVKDRKSGFKTLIKPSKEAQKRLRYKLRILFRKHNGRSCSDLVRAINPVIRGWCNYYRFSVAARVFAHVGDFLFKRQKRWCKRNHLRKPRRWFMKKYFIRHYLCPNFGYTFTDPVTKAYIVHPASVKIQRWVKVKHGHVPDNPDQSRYWYYRSQNTPNSLKPSRASLAKRQKQVCVVCQQSLHNGEAVDLHHRDGDRTNNTYKNLRLVHSVCHSSIHFGSA